MKFANIKTPVLFMLAFFCFFTPLFAFDFSAFSDLSSSVNQREVSAPTFKAFIGNLPTDSLSDTLIIAIKINIPNNYYLYSNPLGPGIGRELNIDFGENKNYLLSLYQTQPEQILPLGEEADNWVWAWREEAVIFALFLRNEISLPLVFNIEGGLCYVSCVPFAYSITINLTEDKLPIFDEYLKEAFAQSIAFGGQEGQSFGFNVRNLADEFSLVTLLSFAFFAGVILNFMPCVLPVLGIKVLSFSQNANRKQAFAKSLAFSAGIISVFLILAIIVVHLQIWWGQQFQNPVFITVLALLMILGALVLFDVFVLSPSNKIANLERKLPKNTLLGNFFRGVCATILATPCSGPLLGAVLAWALIDNNSTAVFTTFLMVGVGMSAPYIFLSICGGVKLSQKIGKYSQAIKKISGVLLVLFALFLLFSAHGFRLLSSTKSVVWQEFTMERFEQAQRDGQSTIVEFTANWCLNCHYNRITVYETDEIIAVIKSRNILALRADLTFENIEAQNLKRQLNSQSLPFMTIFDGYDFTSPFVFRDIVSKRNVLEVLERVR